MASIPLKIDLEVIPRKTEKGRVEVETRAFRVGPKERSVLIMVDGKTPAKALLAQLSFMQKAHTILDELLDGGFIEPAHPVAASALPPGATLPESMHNARRIAHDAVRVLGPRGESLVRRLDNCQSRETLMPLLKRCREEIRSAKGTQKAQEFWMEIELAVKYG